MDEQIKRIIDSLETVAPQAWQVLVDYQRTDAIVGIALSLVFFVAFVILARWGSKGIKDRFDYAPIERILAIVFGIVFSLISFISLAENTVKSINPEGAVIHRMLRAK